MPSYFLAFITALIAVYALTPLVIKFAVKTGAWISQTQEKFIKNLFLV